MNRENDLVILTTTTGEPVRLSRAFNEMASPAIDDIVEVINGDRGWFPPFQVPTYDGEQGLVEVEPGRLEERGWNGGIEEHRLLQFAHLTRPFAWMDDPRHESLLELVRSATTPEGPAILEAASAQDLWDAMFTYARGARFTEGLFAAKAAELTAVANEIRRRLIEAP